MNFRMLLACGLACLLSVGAHAEPGTVTRTVTLVSEPFADADSLGHLPARTTVEVMARDGGWYRVQVNDGRQGWVRLSSIRLAAEESTQATASRFSVTGRSEARTASAKTGIRGLGETDIRDALPDTAALARLATFALDDAEARRFANEAGLEARDVPTLPEKVDATTQGDAR